MVAIRMGDWKAIKMPRSESESGEWQIYNVVKDIAELNNVASQNPDLVAKAAEIAESAHTYNATFPLTEEETERAERESKEKK